MANPTAPRRGERGFTLIETLVASVVLIVGVLAALSLVARANSTTNVTRAREAATNLTREIIEAARSVPYESLTPGSVTGKLQAMSGLGDTSATAGWQIRRRNVTFTVDVASCTYDDPKDGTGTHDSSFCSDSATGGVLDKNPEDYKRVRADVSWSNRGITREVHQVELINNPGSSGAPAVRTLQLTNPTVGSDTIASPAVTSANFSLTTSSTPATLHWLLDGASQGPITSGGGLAWTFSWPLGDPATAGSVVDGTYVVSAEAFNSYNQAGPAKSFTVRINRRVPELVQGAAGGRTADSTAPDGQAVDIEWLPNRDLDIVSYTVYRRDASGSTVICSDVPTDKLQCVDHSPPAQDDLHYYVVAYDLDDAGNPRAGTAPPSDGSGDLVVRLGDTPPLPVLNLQASADADGNVTLSWDRELIPDLDPGDGVDFYRIYRDGITVGDAYARWDDNNLHITFVDSNTGGTTHTYWVTAVDHFYSESTPVGPVSAP